MTDALRPMTKQRLYEQVLERLRQYVADGGLRAGDRLPPERDLAQRLGVSRASVKQAIVVLEVQGLVEARHGGGTYLVRDSLDVEPVEKMVERRRRLPDVLEAREALETKLAELAAERRTEDDLAAMRSALAVMAEEIDRDGHGVEGDRLFHAAVTAAAHSSLLAEFMRSIAHQIAESRTESLRQPGRPVDRAGPGREVVQGAQFRPRCAGGADQPLVPDDAPVRDEHLEAQAGPQGQRPLPGLALQVADPARRHRFRLAQDGAVPSGRRAGPGGAQHRLPAPVGLAHLRDGGAQLAAGVLHRAGVVVGHAAQQDQLEVARGEGARGPLSGRHGSHHRGRSGPWGGRTPIAQANAV